MMKCQNMENTDWTPQTALRSKSFRMVMSNALQLLNQLDTEACKQLIALQPRACHDPWTPLSVEGLHLFWHFKFTIQEISIPISPHLPQINSSLHKRTPVIYFLTFFTCHAGYTYQLFYFNLLISKPVEKQMCKRAQGPPNVDGSEVTFNMWSSPTRSLESKRKLLACLGWNGNGHTKFVCEMAKDLRKIHVYQLRNRSATNVCGSERNFRDNHVGLKDFLPMVAELWPTDHRWLIVRC